MSTEKRVLEIKKELESMQLLINKINEQKCIDLLNELKNLDINFRILQTTSIGLIVNNLRKSTESIHLEHVAKILLKHWKKFIPVTSHLLTRNISEEEEKLLETNDAIRLKCREMLSHALEVQDPFNIHSHGYCDVDLIASRCEQAIFDEFDKKTDLKYKNKLKSIILNLKDEKNVHLKENIRLGIIRPDRLAKMTCEEMANDDLKHLREKLKDDLIKEHQMSYIEGLRSKDLKCEMCGSKRVVYDEIQTTDIEEFLKYFACCQNCGHKWQFT